MNRYICPQCGNLVNHTKFPCKDSYACSLACMKSSVKFAEALKSSEPQTTYQDIFEDTRKRTPKKRR